MLPLHQSPTTSIRHRGVNGLSELPLEEVPAKTSLGVPSTSSTSAFYLAAEVLTSHFADC